MKPYYLSLFLCICVWVQGQKFNEIAQQYADASFEELKEFLALPNDANHQQDLIPNIEWCKKKFEALGFSLKELETPTLPLLLAEKKMDENLTTILIYLQVDGQPVDFSQWNQESPWKAVLKKKNADGKWEIQPWNTIYSNFDPDDRIFARSTADSKGAVMMFLSALKAAKDNNIVPNFNLKVIMDFEEELGSPELPKAVLKYKNDLAADALIIFDGPLHESGEPTLKFGARGIATLTLTTYGPIVAQHSGHYGNYAPNPVLRMSQVLATMKNQQGRVIIPNYYKGVTIDKAVQKILDRVPDDETVMKDRMQIRTPDAVGISYQNSIQYPSLNIRGIKAGWVGNEVRTIIPPSCVAEIDIRLVKESDPEYLINLVKNHIINQGFTVLDHEPTKEERLRHDKIMTFTADVSYGAYRTEFNAPVGKWLSNALEKTHGMEPIKVRTTGGSIPIAPFVNTLGIPAVGVPTVNLDNNQHSPNENIRLGNYVKGIETFLGILSEPYEE